MYVFSIANQTNSRVRVRICLERVANILKQEHKRGCPAFCDEDGYILTSSDVEEVMHPILTMLQGEPGLEQSLPRGIDIESFYRCERSFRRGAETTALVSKVNKRTIEFVHRWRSFEKNRGNFLASTCYITTQMGNSLAPYSLISRRPSEISGKKSMDSRSQGQSTTTGSSDREDG